MDEKDPAWYSFIPFLSGYLDKRASTRSLEERNLAAAQIRVSALEKDQEKLIETLAAKEAEIVKLTADLEYERSAHEVVRENYERLKNPPFELTKNHKYILYLLGQSNHGCLQLEINAILSPVSHNDIQIMLDEMLDLLWLERSWPFDGVRYMLTKSGRRELKRLVDSGELKELES